MQFFTVFTSSFIPSSWPALSHVKPGTLENGFFFFILFINTIIKFLLSYLCSTWSGCPGWHWWRGRWRWCRAPSRRPPCPTLLPSPLKKSFFNPEIFHILLTCSPTRPVCCSIKQVRCLHLWMNCNVWVNVGINCIRKCKYKYKDR